MPKKGKPGVPSLVEQIQTAIRDSGQSLNQLEKACDLATGQLSRFMRGQRTITLPIAEKILRALNKEAILRDAGEAKGNPSGV
jgi:hypothetical protein